jgi:predicted N-acyltransferase
VNYFQHFEPEYLLLRNDISMEMEIPAEWDSFADYENALKHKYAQRLRKLRQSWQPLEVKELDEAAIIAQKEELYNLYRQVSDHQQVRMGFLNADFLPSLRRFYGDALKVWAVYEDGKMIAFLSAWVKDDVFDMFYIGFDYDRNSVLYLYFNILFFSLELAISFKKKKLILGRTALDAKARLGCRPRYLSTFVYIKNRRLRNYILHAQQRMTVEEGSWESKHPFKK